MPNVELDNLSILVTRPAIQAQTLSELITQAGWNPILFPVIEIIDVVDTKVVYEAIDCLDEFDLAIFISVNAVNQALKYILAQRELPTKLKLATIGQASAEALRKGLEREPDICPKSKFNSEALLDMEPMQNVKGQSIVIFRGTGGREYLGDQLGERGAKVRYVSVYQSSQPSVDAGKLSALQTKQGIDAIIITSVQGLHNLCAMLENTMQDWLKNTQLIVINERLIDVAQQLGFQKMPIVADEASDTAIVEVIKRWYRKGINVTSS